MRVGDVVKYHFPDPQIENKKFILAIVSFVNEAKISLDCEDGTCLMVSYKNFDRIELLNKINLKNKELVS